jgi:uncharacterized protein
MERFADYLVLNIGFIVHEMIGYSRDFPFDAEFVRLPPDLILNPLHGTVRVTRTAQGLLVQTKMRANIASECVRCLDEFSQVLDVDYTDLYAFTRDSLTESGLLVPENGKIDLAPILREEMLLAIPISPLCKPDCRGLCAVCGENLNSHPHSHVNEEDGDSQLGLLGSLLK